MRLWRVVLLVNLALAVGLLIGYLAWGLQIPRLQKDLDLARKRGAVQAVEQTFNAQGVVRAILPEINVLILTHEDIPGFMSPMTMGFRTREPALLDGIEVGDSVRFTIKGVPPNLVITEITKQGKS